MKFSLIQIYKEECGFIEGVWVQDHIGTLETASKVARETEIANSKRIQIAVVEDLSCIIPPNYNLIKNLKRLDRF